MSAAVATGVAAAATTAATFGPWHTGRAPLATVEPATPQVRPTEAFNPARVATIGRPSPQPVRPAPRKPPRRPTPPVPVDGSGEFSVVPVGDAVSTGSTSFTVEIEDGLGFVPGQTARMVERTLNDERGWVAVAGATFGRVEQDGELRVLLATPTTTDELCAPLQTLGKVSCRNGDMVVLNAMRWATGIDDYEGDLRAYRRYLVNHEVGHALGQEHEECPAAGAPAPVMMQQTYGLEGCARNPWPSVA